MNTRIELRPATAADADLLLRWRNDPETRAQSFETAEVAPREHVLWLDEKLSRPDRCRIWVAEADGRPVGQARIDRYGAKGVISVALAAADRGRGLGAALIEAATARAVVELELERVDALVKPDNAASLAAFRRAGYAEVQRRPDAVVLTRSAS